MAPPAFLQEIEEIKASLNRQVKQVVTKYFAGRPSDQTMVEWLRVRCWREMDYVLLISELLLRYNTELDNTIIISLSKQLWDEARHYEMVGALIRGLGGEPPRTVLPVEKEWHDVLWEGVKKDRICTVAAWNVSETAAAASMPDVIAGAERCGYPEVARTYRRIDKDEVFHLNLGVEIVKRYGTTPQSQGHALWGARHIYNVLTRSWQAIYGQ